MTEESLDGGGSRGLLEEAETGGLLGVVDEDIGDVLRSTSAGDGDGGVSALIGSGFVATMGSGDGDVLGSM